MNPIVAARLSDDHRNDLAREAAARRAGRGARHARRFAARHAEGRH